MYKDYGGTPPRALEKLHHRKLECSKGVGKYEGEYFLHISLSTWVCFVKDVLAKGGGGGGGISISRQDTCTYTVKVTLYMYRGYPNSKNFLFIAILHNIATVTEAH